MLFGASLFPALICGLAFLINFIAIYYHASRAIPFFTMVSIWLTSSVMDIRIMMYLHLNLFPEIALHSNDVCSLFSTNNCSLAIDNLDQHTHVE